MLLEHAEFQAPSPRAYFLRWAKEAFDLALLVVALVSTYLLMQVIEDMAALL